jgi:hypothetical protein
MYDLEPHQEWQRLSDIYHAMSDDDLLELAAKRDELTQIANEVLGGELSRRKIFVQKPAPAFPFQASMGRSSNDSVIQHGKVSPITFFDAIHAGRACEYLKEAGVEFELKDLWEPDVGVPALKGPPAVLQLFVDKADDENTKAILREKMGLFPLQEVSVADEPIDDGTVTDLGYFARRDEVDEVARVLEEAHVWHRIVADPDGNVEDENCYRLEVKEIDAVRAGQLIERVLNFPEE